MIKLKDLNPKNVIEVIKLTDTLSDAHKKLVAPNAVSISQAYVTKEALPRAIYLGDDLVGFIMMYYGPDDEKPGVDVAYLWRYMIATDFQGKGFGKQALDLVFNEAQEKGFTEVYASVGQGEGNALDFYKKVGFVPTGEIDHGEVVIKKIL